MCLIGPVGKGGGGGGGGLKLQNIKCMPTIGGGP